VDGVPAAEYAKDLQANLQALAERLKTKRYRAQRVRRVYIPKDNGTERPLGIPALEDKLVQLACAKLLVAIYEQDFLACSYGYRPERGALDAVRELTFDLQYGVYGYVVEADVKGFFDNLDHDWLLEMLRLRIDDRAFLGLIRQWLKAGILETDGAVMHPETGTPQGGVVSPVLANVYLHYALDLPQRLEPGP
jgi:RNA-directed DNA polymerase